MNTVKDRLVVGLDAKERADSHSIEGRQRGNFYSSLHSIHVHVPGSSSSMAQNANNTTQSDSKSIFNREPSYNTLLQSQV